MNDNIWVQEDFCEVQQVRDADGSMDERTMRLGQSEPYESFTDNPGELYRSCMKEHGRCTSHVYRHGPDGKPIKIGWVFRKRRMYQDARSKEDTYLQEVWVTLHKGPPTRTVEYHELDLDKIAKG